MKMGTCSLWRYDAGANQALQSENPRQPALRCEISQRRDRQTHPLGRSVTLICNKAVLGTSSRQLPRGRIGD
jgi:hypothetical protein